MNVSNSMKLGSPGRLLIYVLVVCAIVFLVQLPAVNSRASFMDDHQYVLDNPAVKNLSWSSVAKFLREVWRPTTVEGYYQPATMISLMLDYSQGGFPYRLSVFRRTNLLLHVINTSLIAVLLYLLFESAWAAAVTSLLFGLHPMTVDSICWLSERKTVLATFFALLSLIFYVLSARREKKRYLAVSLLTYALGLLSKPTVVPLPVMMILLDYWPLRRMSARSLLDKLPFIFLGAMLSIITVVSQSRSSAIALPDSDVVERLLLLSRQISFYFRKMLWPVRVSPHYHYDSGDLNIADTKMIADVLLVGSIFVSGLLSLRWTRGIAVGIVFFFAGLFPTMGSIRFTDTIVANRYAYIPSLGILIIIAVCLESLQRRIAHERWRIGFVVKLVGGTVLLVIVVFEAIITQHYLQKWRDTERLYKYVLRISPEATKFYIGLGAMYGSRGDVEQAIASYQRTFGKMPWEAQARSNLGGLLRNIPGRENEAIQHCLTALSLEPNLPEAHYNIGQMYMSDGNIMKAIYHLRKGAEKRPYFLPGRRRLAEALLRVGKPQEALDELIEMQKIDPSYGPALNDAAFILSTHPDPNVFMPEEALRMAEKASHLNNGRNCAVLATLAAAYAANGAYTKAVSIAEEALKIASNQGVDRLDVQIKRQIAHYRRGERYIAEPNGPAPDRLADSRSGTPGGVSLPEMLPDETDAKESHEYSISAK